VRLLLLSDIHAAEAALERVLADAERRGWDRLVFLGDAVGYGAEPEAVLQRLISLRPLVALQGNHELMLLQLLAGEEVHAVPDIIRVLEGHAAALSDASLAFIRGLPLEHLNGDWAAVHGGLRDPWEYIISIPAARANLPHMRRPLYFVGHTHVPGAFLHHVESGRWQARAFRSAENRLQLPEGARAFINPGAVGKARDGLPGAAYAIYDEKSRTVESYRLGL